MLVQISYSSKLALGQSFLEEIGKAQCKLTLQIHECMQGDSHVAPRIQTVSNQCIKQTQKSFKLYLFTTPVLIFNCRFGSDAEAILIAKKYIDLSNKLATKTRAPINYSNIVGLRLGRLFIAHPFNGSTAVQKVIFLPVPGLFDILGRTAESIRKCECFAQILLLKLNITKNTLIEDFKVSFPSVNEEREKKKPDPHFQNYAQSVAVRR